MKKMKAFLNQIAFGKRATGFCLALALLLSAFAGFSLDLFSIPAAAVEEKPYYGSHPQSDGYYYWHPGNRGYFAMPDSLIEREDLFDRFNQSGMFYIESDINSRVDYSLGYGNSQMRFYGRMDMAEKWKISSFNVSISAAKLSDHFKAYKTEPLRVALILKDTSRKGLSRDYHYNGRKFDSGHPSSSDFIRLDRYTSEISSQGRLIATYEADLSSTISNFRAIIAETERPHVWSWKLQNRENDTPLLWMIFNEELFPADEDLLNRELLSKAFNIEIIMTPRVDPNGTPMTVRATCTEFVFSDTADLESPIGDVDGTGRGMLGFEINSEDWAELQASGQEWVIRTVKQKFDTSTSYKIKYPYPIRDYAAPSRGSDKYFETKYPIVDTVGNPLVVFSTYNDINITIDTVDPYVTQVNLKGDSLPASNTSGIQLDSWADTPDLEWRDLFAGKDDSFYATVELNEKVRNLTEDQKNAIYLEWGVNDKRTGQPMRTYLAEQKVAAYVNGSSDITLLVFAPLDVKNLDPEDSGRSIKPVKLHGAEHLQDFTNNSMTEADDENGGVYTLPVAPDKQIFFDLKGPVVELGEVVGPVADPSGNFVTYSVELNISDKTSDESGRYFAGMVGGDSTVVGSFSMYSRISIPSFNYSYSLLPAEAAVPDGNYDFSGRLTGTEAQAPSPMTVLKEGNFILYLKIDSIDGMEIPDSTGITLDFALWDILGNQSTQTVDLRDLALDKAKPTVSATGHTEIVSGQENSATFHATVIASDINGINLIEYKWGGDSVPTQAQQSTGSVTYEISKTVSGTGLIEDTLEIKVYDTHGNVTEKTLSFSADLSKYLPQVTALEENGMPTNVNDVIISAPLSTADGGAVAGYVRVDYIDKATNDYYIGTAAIGADQTISIFGDQLRWFKVEPMQDRLGPVTAVIDISFLTSVYGELEFTVWASKNDLSVEEGDEVDPSGTDTHAQKTEVAILRTSKRDNAHSVTFGDVTLSGGTELTVSNYQSGEGELGYHKLFLHEFVGTQYPFSIENTIVPAWTTVDVDWTNSFAVLLKVNNDGTLPETDVEVTNRIPLTGGIDHCLVVPGLDKDGRVFTTGVYVWKVCIAQKAGGSQTFVAPTRLLLDAVELDGEFGVYSYTGQVSHGTGSRHNVDDGSGDALQQPLYLEQKNEDGSPLSVINVAMAPSTDFRNPTIVKDGDGNDAFAYVTVKATEELAFEILINREKLEDETYMGEDLGVIAGFRYWNANAPVNLDKLPFELDIEREGVRGLRVNQCLDDSQVDMYVLVDDLSGLSPAESEKDFRLTMGRNRIAYQMKLESGEISPVQYIDVILRPTAPTVSVSFTPGPGREEKIDLGDGSIFTQNHVQYVTASIDNFTSVSGGLDFYQLTYDERYDKYVRKQITDPSNIILTAGSYGMNGLPQNDGYYDVSIQDYILAVDGYGNAVIILPIIGRKADATDPTYKNVIVPELGKLDGVAINGIPNEDGRYKLVITHAFSDESDNRISRIVDGYSIQLDDGEPVYVDAFGSDIAGKANAAGIELIEAHGSVTFAFPYDPELNLGETATRTVTVKAYLNGEETDSGKATYWGVPNMRATLIPTDKNFGRTGLWARYTDLTDEQLANGNYYGNNGNSFSNTKVMMSGDNVYDGYPVICTPNGGLYTVTFTNKHGEVREQQMLISLPEDPKVEFSTTDPTAGPVIVTLTSEQYELSVGGVTSYEDPEYFDIAVPDGTGVEGNGTKSLKLTLYQNTDFDKPSPDDPTVQYSFTGIPIHYGEGETLYICVDNIFNQPVAPKVSWGYTDEEVYETYERDGTTYYNVVLGAIDAFLVDENDIPLIDPLTGETPRFTFYPGGETSYTFSGYENIVGAKGEDVTATLPVTLLDYEVNVLPKLESEPVADIWAPNVGISGSAVYDDGAQAIQAAFVQETARTADSPIADIASAWLSDWGTAYGDDHVFTDIDELIAAFGWADAYRLNLSILDESATKVFITADDYTAVPLYEGGQSDSVKGVSLIGKAVTVTENCSFVIHVVDESNNAVSIPVTTVAVGTDAPAPGYVLTRSPDGTEVRVYLTLPNLSGASDLKITTGTFEPHPDAKTENDTASSFYGLDYLVYTQVGPQTVYYTYQLNGRRVEGSVSFKVDNIDTSGLTLSQGYPKWSANYDANATADNLSEPWIRLTSQSITAQLSFNKNLSDAYFVDENGNKITPANASVSFLGAQATVEYSFNEGKLKLVCVSATNKNLTCSVELPAIVTVDKTAPTVESEVSYSANRRSAVITLKVNEYSIQQSNGKSLTLVEGETPYYTTEKTVKENGEYTFILTDRAGNRTVKTVQVTDIINGELTLLVSTSEDDAGIIDPETYVPEPDASLYVKTNRDAEITMDNTSVSIPATAGQWVAVTIPENLSGLYPTIRAMDSYGNTAIVQLESVPVKDVTSPKVIIRKELISVPLNSTDDELKQLLKDNILASDDTTPANQLVYSFAYNRPAMGGKVDVSYHVTDSAGNTATVDGTVRFYTDKELKVQVNGEVVERDYTVVVKKGSIDLFIDSAGEPYKIMWKTGIKTVSQVKIGAETLTSYTDEKKSYAPEFTNVGYYTVVVTTQSQNTYRIILYVED